MVIVPANCNGNISNFCFSEFLIVLLAMLNNDELFILIQDMQSRGNLLARTPFEAIVLIILLEREGHILTFY